MKKILIIRFSSIGDIVLASPVFRCLKNQLPNTEIHFCTKTQFKAVTEHNPYIDAFHYFDNNWESLLQQLKAQQFDCIIDLHHNIRSNQIKKALGIPSHTIKKLTVEKFLLTSFKLNVMPNRHITQRSLDTVAPLGVKDDGLGLDYFIAAPDEVKLNDIPTSHHLGYIAMVIGANHQTKKMPIEKWQQLCHAIQHPIMILGGKAEVAEAMQIASIDPIKIYNACGKFSLNESASLIQQSRLVISHDTGLQYVACAFQKPVIAIWGGTSPKLAVEPYYGSAVNASKKKYVNFVLNLWCQPCSKYGRANCPLGHFNCMKKQPIEAIAAKAMEMLK